MTVDGQITEDQFKQVQSVNDDYSNSMITLADAEHRLLSLIDAYGANVVLDNVREKLRESIRRWLESAPRTAEGWGEMKVFNSTAGTSTVPEFKAVSMSEGEIQARLSVIRSLERYFEKCQNG